MLSGSVFGLDHTPALTHIASAETLATSPSNVPNGETLVLTLGKEGVIDLPTAVLNRLPLYREPCLLYCSDMSILTGVVQSLRPDSAALALESTNENELVERFEDVNRTAESRPYRPSYGLEGDAVEFWTNYFPVKLPDEMVLHRYSITIDVEYDEGKQLPEPRNKKLRRIITLLLEKLDPKLQLPIATDFKSTLVCGDIIPQRLWVTKIKYFHEDDRGARNDSRTYTIRIEETPPVLKISELKNFLASRTVIAPFSDRESILHALNIIFGHHAKSSPAINMVGGNKAFNNAKTQPQHAEQQSLEDGLEAIRGYYLSVRLATFRTIVNVNVCHGAFYKTLKLTDVIDNWAANSFNWEKENLKWDKLETFLKGVKVKTNYLKDANRSQVTQVRSIKSFASIKDGEGTNHPPKVRYYAAPPREVLFYQDDEKDVRDVTKQMSKAKDKKNCVDNKYIRVAEFFKKSTPISYSSPYPRLTSLRVQHRFRSTRKIPSPQLCFTKRSHIRAG